MPNMTVPVKPQSIFHRLVRVGNKVELGKKSKRRSSASASTYYSKSTTSDESSEMLSSSQSTYCNDLPQHEFEIVNQNEFVENVLIDNCSDTDCIVHFTNEESPLSIDVEDHVLEVLRGAPKRKYDLYHIDSQMAPYFTSKLNINKEEPTLLRFKNGKLIGRISFASFEDCYCQLEQWLKDTEQKDDFASLSIPV